MWVRETRRRQQKNWMKQWHINMNTLSYICTDCALFSTPSTSLVNDDDKTALRNKTCRLVGEKNSTCFSILQNPLNYCFLFFSFRFKPFVKSLLFSSFLLEKKPIFSPLNHFHSQFMRNNNDINILKVKYPQKSSECVHTVCMRKTE